MLATPFYNWFLDHLSDYPGNYLEIGVYDGEGISSLARKYRGKKFYGVDPFIEDGNTSQLTGVSKGQPLSVQEAKARDLVKFLPNVEFFRRTSEDFAKTLSPEYISLMNLSVVFVDGDHSYECCQHDLALANRIIRTIPAVIAADDLHLPGVKRAVDEFLGKGGYQTENIGFHLLLKKVEDFSCRPPESVI